MSNVRPHKTRTTMTQLLFQCFAVAVFLSACASSQPPPRTDLSPDQAMARFQAAACCHSLAQVVSASLQPEILIPAAGGTTLLNSPAGKGFYGAFSIPEDGQIYYFRVESLVLRSSEWASNVATPLVLILNRDFTISRASNFSMLTYHPENKFYGERESLYMFIKVDHKERPEEKYVVVTTFEKLLGRDIEFTSTIGGGVTVIPLGNTVAVAPANVRVQKATLRVSPVGQIRLLYLASKWNQPASDRSVPF
jgi:hypothetical protein